MTQPAAVQPALVFEQFKETMLAQGYQEVVERQWAPDTVIETHTHTFEASAVITQGEMWLDVQGEGERRLQAGDRFHLLPDVAHSERYGADGATYWVARKSS